MTTSYFCFQSSVFSQTCTFWYNTAHNIAAHKWFCFPATRFFPISMMSLLSSSNHAWDFSYILTSVLWYSWILLLTIPLHPTHVTDFYAHQLTICLRYRWYIFSFYFVLQIVFQWLFIAAFILSIHLPNLLLAMFHWINTGHNLFLFDI